MTKERGSHLLVLRRWREEKDRGEGGASKEESRGLSVFEPSHPLRAEVFGKSRVIMRQKLPAKRGGRYAAFLPKKDMTSFLIDAPS